MGKLRFREGKAPAGDHRVMGGVLGFQPRPVLGAQAVNDLNKRSTGLTVCSPYLGNKIHHVRARRLREAS